MVTVIVPTTRRPAMLRNALCSIDRQTAKAQIGLVIVSENAGDPTAGEVCREFPSLPIRYIFREPPISPLQHGLALFCETAALPDPYVAVLHDDDWWGPQHLANGLAALEKNPDAAAYWCSSFLVHGERSWIIQCWNEQCWIAAGFGPLNEVAKLDRKQAALAAVGSGPAHYSGLIAEKHAIFDSYRDATKSGNLFDNDRLLFIELSKRGPLLVNFIPEIFVRQHPAQDQRSIENSGAHVSAATLEVLEFCKQEGVDVLSEFERRYQECPIPDYRPFITATFDPRAVMELRRQNLLPLQTVPGQRVSAKAIVRNLCPPVCWAVGKGLKDAICSVGGAR